MNEADKLLGWEKEDHCGDIETGGGISKREEFSEIFMVH